MRRAMGLDGLDEQPERHPDARVSDDARRGRDRRACRTGAAVGPARARVPRGRRRTVGGRGGASQERTATRRARHRPGEGQSHADGAHPRRRGGRAGSRRGDEGGVARRPRPARRGFRGAHGAAVAVRPAHPRPGSRRGAIRLRIHPRDVQAGRQAPLGLLRAPDSPRRPAHREARRCRRPQVRRAAGERDPRGREVHPRHDQGRAVRA